MRVRARTIVLALLALVVVLILAVITSMGWAVVLGPSARAVTDRTFEPTEARLARGRYLAEGPAACFHCHTDHDFTDPEYPILQAKKGAGWAMPIPELGSVVAPNITPDPETGLGAWTDDEIARAIQEGISRDGRALFPVMPYLNYRDLTPEDVASIVVYLRSIPPVRHDPGRTKLVFPLSFLVNTMPQPLASHAPGPARTTPEARGEYLVRTVAGCQDCHSAFDDQGMMLAGTEFGGGSVFHDPGRNMQEVVSLNITMDPSGIAHYDESLFIQTLRSGIIGGHLVSRIMPFEFFRNLSDEDLIDMFAYLRTRPPVKHRVSNTDPPAPCAVCGRSHGLGEFNQKGS